MPNLVCTGATLQCSSGTTPATFRATGTRVSAGGPAGVVTDVTIENVPPFGLCMSLGNPQVRQATTALGQLSPQPCQPLLSPWSPGAMRVTIGGVTALDDSSRCTCSYNGVVTVKTPPGQKASSLR
jgi:hypothetical protein